MFPPNKINATEYKFSFSFIYFLKNNNKLIYPDNSLRKEKLPEFFDKIVYNCSQLFISLLAFSSLQYVDIRVKFT